MCKAEFASDQFNALVTNDFEDVPKALQYSMTIVHTEFSLARKVAEDLYGADKVDFWMIARIQESMAKAYALLVAEAHAEKAAELRAATTAAKRSGRSKSR